VNWSLELVADVPTGVVTVMSTVAALSAGLVALIEVEELTLKLLAAVVPNATAVAPVKLVPVTVTTVPPANGPLAGLTAVTVGAPSKVNWSAEDVADVPEELVTVMSTVPALSAGLVAVIEVDELTV
jgi:hypothetical protein